jgi:hypothetical protein
VSKKSSANTTTCHARSSNCQISQDRSNRPLRTSARKIDHSGRLKAKIDSSRCFESLTISFPLFSAISTQSPFWLKLLLRHVGANSLNLVMCPSQTLLFFPGNAGYERSSSRKDRCKRGKVRRSPFEANKRQPYNSCCDSPKDTYRGLVHRSVPRPVASHLRRVCRHGSRR